jgi:hypothetical protein
VHGYFSFLFSEISEVTIQPSVLKMKGRDCVVRGSKISDVRKTEKAQRKGRLYGFVEDCRGDLFGKLTAPKKWL